MAQKLFEKVGAFGDIHFGEDGNSKEHNELCIKFIKWFIEQCRENDVDLIVFMGDWHHARSSVGSETLKYSYEGTKLLNECGIPVIFIIGNHDLFYRENRSVHSLPWLDSMDNIVVIDDPQVIEDVLFVPWICEGDDLSKIAQMKAKYAFGHFELPGFLMNEKYAFPDKEGILKSEDLTHLEYVFSGHFHGRQKKVMKSGTEIHYIGNPFGHNFNDVDDPNRGMLLLEHGGEPQYINWEEGPLFSKIKLSEYLENPDKYDERYNLKIVQDVDLTDTERNELKETINENYSVKKLIIEPDRTPKVDEETDDTIEELDADSIEKFVIDWLKRNEGNRSDALIDIFLKAEVE